MGPDSDTPDVEDNKEKEATDKVVEAERSAEMQEQHSAARTHNLFMDTFLSGGSTLGRSTSTFFLGLAESDALRLVPVRGRASTPGIGLKSATRHIRHCHYANAM